MDAALKELAKLENLTSSKGKSQTIDDSLESLLQALHDVKARVHAGEVHEETFQQLTQTIDNKRRDIDDRQKEIYNSITRLGKTLDKKFPSPLPSYSNLFASPDSYAALERTIALHFLRTGQFEIAECFLEESEIVIPPTLKAQFVDLYQILKALRNQEIQPALAWAKQNRQFLQSRSSPLEFYLHRSQYIRLLLASHPPDPRPALIYARELLRPFYGEHEMEFKRLITCVAYLPLRRLQQSPYADLTSTALHFDLEPLFAKEYCASLGMSRQVPLRVVGDIGGGGALARIEKGRKVMRERKSEWSQTDELPIEIPLPPENRYHSIFACPVSKEQSSESNPPMMLSCGHVITKDSLNKMGKTGSHSTSKVKCPYCPTESVLTSVVRVYF